MSDTPETKKGSPPEEENPAEENETTSRENQNDTKNRHKTSKNKKSRSEVLPIEPGQREVLVTDAIAFLEDPQNREKYFPHHHQVTPRRVHSSVEVERHNATLSKDREATSENENIDRAQKRGNNNHHQKEERAAFVASMPDFSEFPSWSLERWKAWFVNAAKLILSNIPPKSVAIFFQSDIRETPQNWVDKSYLCQKAAEEVSFVATPDGGEGCGSGGCTLLWHKICCRTAPGNPTTSRPGYSHMLCFGRGDLDDPGQYGFTHAMPDVLAQVGHKSWARGMGSDVCVFIAKFLHERIGATTVVNPFCGEGQLLAACNALGMKAVGVELSPKRAMRARVALMARDGSLPLDEPASSSTTTAAASLLLAPPPTAGGGGEGSRSEPSLGTTTTFRLHVNHISQTVTDAELRQCFEQCGVVESATIMCDPVSGHRKGHGFVTFTNQADAMEAVVKMTGFKLQNSLKVTLAK